MHFVSKIEQSPLRLHAGVLVCPNVEHLVKDETAKDLKLKWTRLVSYCGICSEALKMGEILIGV